MQIEETAKAINESSASQKEKDNELFSRMKLQMIQAHIQYIQFYLYRTQLEKTEIKDSRIKPILLELYRIAVLRSLLDDPGSVFESEFFVPVANSRMKSALDNLIRKVRPQLIPLVESINDVDTLPSNIGNFYGDIYEQQLDQAMDSGMNKLDKDGVPPQWEQYIKPFLHEDVPVTKAKL